MYEKATQMYDLKLWLPTTKKEIALRGWDELDVILFSGDAYIDHPSFGIGVIGRVLENIGLRVAIVPQPNWKDDLRDFKKLGKPRLFFGVSSGAMDSMVNHYTANKRLRSSDAYTAGGDKGYRPDYATTVYSKILREFYPDTPIILGGIEASLRRFTHYDYWQDCLKPSIVHESGADMLVYGFGEKAIVEIATLLDKGVPIEKLQTIPQTAFLANQSDKVQKPKKWEEELLASHEDCLSDKLRYAKNFTIIERESNKFYSKRLIQEIGDKKLVVNPSYEPMNSKEVDAVYDLPYTRLPHPKYQKRGKIPAYEMIRFSVNIHRGCFGGCSFCTIAAHQGKFVVNRSEASVIEEIKKIAELPEYRGHLSDLGGPSANMYMLSGKDLSLCKKCAKASCLYPKVCKNLNTDHSQILALYRKVRQMAQVKKVTIGSGVRLDLFNKNDKSHQQYIEELIQHHVSGRLKVAPEHTEDKVLNCMRKYSFAIFKDFNKQFAYFNKKHGLNQQLIPYFISSHPGSEKKDMDALALKVKGENIRPEQVQDFTPTPMTLATVMYYSGINPYTLESVYVARNKEAKLQQKDAFFWYDKNNSSTRSKEYFGKKSSNTKKRKPKKGR